MRVLISIFLLSSMTSCGWITSKEEKTHELVQKELQQIDFDAVDSYPLFEDCDETQTPIGQRECFEQQVLSNCSQILNQYEFILGTTINKNVYVDFLVDQDGRVSVLNIEKDNSIDDLMPEFDQLIRQGLEDLPPLAPALKRGIPVKAKFRIPIVLNSN